MPISKDDLDKRLEELDKAKEELFARYQQIIGAIAVLKDLLKSKETKPK